MEPAQVEAMLTMIFKAAGRWKAILVIDEAEIFMAQYCSEHLQLNTLVSVFLRQLEQYDGILFLTTNRLQTFDGAILSQIQASLKYTVDNANLLRMYLWRECPQRSLKLMTLALASSTRAPKV